MESIPELTPVDPVRPVAPYVGGKRNLSSRLVELIDQVPHTTYAEPFVGQGGVFFRRRRRPPVEIINDLANDVATLFRVLQVHYVAFVDMLRYQLATRAEFDRLVATDPETLTDLQRAARFLYLQRVAFGGKVVSRHFGMGHRHSPFDVTRLVPMLEDVHVRLAGVTIERLPFDRFIQRYDRPGVLFYLDPPYWGSEHYYGRELFSRADYDLLRGVLGGLQGRFILSLNDRPETRALLAGFDLQTASVSYGLGAGVPQRSTELIATGGGS